MTGDFINVPTQSRFRLAMGLAVAADVIQLALFPFFIAGADFPADDVLDVGMGAVLTYLLGWHWEFAPSFLAKLVPGIDLVPLWTLAVANVYRKSKRLPVVVEGVRTGAPGRSGPQN
jgi:hypothetical protein